MDNFTKFLFQLSEDNEIQNRFNTNPNEVMNQAGLSEAQKEALLSKESEKISSAIAEENKTFANSNAKWTILVLITIKF